jgi:hypothetical protein
MSKPFRFLRWLFDEFMAALLVIAFLAMFWVAVLKRHMLPIAHGERGSYAEVAIPEVLTLDTKLLSFTAAVVPGRVVSVAGHAILPLPDMLEVQVRYSDEARVERVWERSFFIVCDEDEFCAPIAALSGVVLAGKARGSGTEVLGWAELKPRIPVLKEHHAKPKPEPSPSPAPKAPSAPVQAT